MVDPRRQEGSEKKLKRHMESKVKIKKKLMISYTNIDGLLSKMLELND